MSETWLINALAPQHFTQTSCIQKGLQLKNKEIKKFWMTFQGARQTPESLANWFALRFSQVDFATELNVASLTGVHEITPPAAVARVN